MILSVSRRTDIPACYSEWFFNRLRAGYVCVRNPMNFHQVSRIALTPDVVDGIVFWTKNPLPMLPRLDELQSYPYYFQFTLNAYGPDLECGLPSKNDVLLPAFRALSEKIGPERVIWRYDPILLTTRYTVQYHLHYFEELARRLSGYTRKCIISFVDLYRSTRSNTKELGLAPLTTVEMYSLAQGLAEIAGRYGLVLESCAEEIALEPFGIPHGHCIDRELLEQLLGCRLDLGKDKNQRTACGCAASIDIGMYNTCRNGCKYCYATYSPALTARNAAAHDPASPLLSGQLLPEDVVTERPVCSCRDGQLNFLA